MRQQEKILKIMLITFFTGYLLHVGNINWCFTSKFYFKLKIIEKYDLNISVNCLISLAATKRIEIHSVLLLTLLCHCIDLDVNWKTICIWKKRRKKRTKRCCFSQMKSITFVPLTFWLAQRKKNKRKCFDIMRWILR